MRNGNSNKLCDEFERGCTERANIVKRINIRDIKLNFCIACRDCYNYGDCVQKDDMNSVYPYIKEADVLVFATPIYFGEMSGQLKTFIDRMYPLYTNLDDKDVYIISSCYQDDKKYIDESVKGLTRSLKNLGLTNIKQIVYGENTDESNDITVEQLSQAYLLGLKI